MKYKTPWTKENEVTRKWYIVDVKGKILGRSATKIASLLMGKDKVETVSNVDCGDHVIVINSKEVELTRGKELKKMYYRHSGYPGALKETRFDQMQKRRPNYIIERAVKLMIPDNKLRASRMSRLHIYSGSEHEQTAQQPVEIKL